MSELATNTDESILTSVKHMLGIEPDVTHFDSNLILFINSAFYSVNQLGVGPDNPYHINGSTEKWTDFSADINDFEAVIQYVYLKVKMAFDPPLSGTVIGEYNKQIDELAWRITAKVDIEEGRANETSDQP